MDVLLCSKIGTNIATATRFREPAMRLQARCRLQGTNLVPERESFNCTPECQLPHRLIARSPCQGDLLALGMNARTRISSGHFIAGTFCRRGVGGRSPQQPVDAGFLQESHVGARFGVGRQPIMVSRAAIARCPRTSSPGIGITDTRAPPRRSRLGSGSLRAGALALSSDKADVVSNIRNRGQATHRFSGRRLSCMSSWPC